MNLQRILKPFDFQPLVSFVSRLRREPPFATITILIAIIPLFFVFSSRAPVAIVLLLEIGLIWFTKSRSKEAASYLTSFLATIVVLFIFSELFFRIQYLGMDHLSPSKHTPHLYSCEGTSLDTYTGFIPGDTIAYRGQTYIANAEGFRGPSYSKEKPEDVFRIVYVGASFGLGAGVAEGERFTDYLEKELNTKMPISKQFQIINLSIGGASIGSLLDVLKEVGVNYKPDLIFLEIGRPVVRFTKHLDIFHPNLSCEANNAIHFLGDRTALWSQFFFVNYMSSIFGSLFPKIDYADQKTIETVVKQGFSAAKEIAGQTPVVAFRVPPMSNSPDEKVFSEMVKRIAESEEISVFDGEEVSLPEPLEDWNIFPGDPHPNSKAHKLIATYLFREFIDQRLW
jgi:hypothetical protein